MKKLLAMIAAFGLTALLLSSCSPKGNTGTTTTNTTNTTNSTASGTGTSTDTDVGTGTNTSTSTDTTTDTATSTTTDTAATDYKTLFGMTKEDVVAKKGQGESGSGGSLTYNEGFGALTGKSSYEFGSDNKLEKIVVTFDNANSADDVRKKIDEVLGSTSGSTSSGTSSEAANSWTKDGVSYNIVTSGSEQKLEITKQS